MINKQILIGNLGADPETHIFDSGSKVTNITVATSRKWKDKTSGEQKEETEWFRVAFFNKLADIVEMYLVKGSQVYIEGRTRTRKWTDKDGVERYSTEVIAETMKMLGSKGGEQSSTPNNKNTQLNNSATLPTRYAPQQNNSTSDQPVFDDDIPF